MTDNRIDERSPGEIEREIRNTQRDMSKTVDDLERQMTPRNLFNSLLDKGDENDIDARYLLDAARRNPLALGMIAIGGLWLVSDADARPSALKPSKDEEPLAGGAGWHDPEHRTYVEHMTKCEPRHDEDDAAYRRRRDHARASYLMLEQRHDEDDHSFRKRLDDATEKMREQRQHLSERTREAVGRTREQAGNAASSVQRTYAENPLLGGLAAAFIGALAGAAIPVSRTEEEYLGSTGEKVLHEAKVQADRAGDYARQKKDELMENLDTA